MDNYLVYKSDSRDGRPNDGPTEIQNALQFDLQTDSQNVIYFIKSRRKSRRHFHIHAYLRYKQSYTFRREFRFFS